MHQTGNRLPVNYQAGNAQRLPYTAIAVTAFVLTIYTFYLFAQRGVLVRTLADAIIESGTRHPTCSKQMLQCMFGP